MEKLQKLFWFFFPKILQRKIKRQAFSETVANLKIECNVKMGKINSFVESKRVKNNITVYVKNSPKRE